MILNKEGKLFGKISIIDVCTLFIILLVVTVGIISYINASSVSGEDSQITTTNPAGEICVELKLSDVDDYTKNTIITGNKIYLCETGKYFGEITKINSTPHQELISGTDGTMVFSDVPEKYDLNLYVKVSGRHTEQGFYSSENLHLACGDTLPIKTETAEVTSVIRKVYLITEENVSEIVEKSQNLH